MVSVPAVPVNISYQVHQLQFSMFEVIALRQQTHALTALMHYAKLLSVRVWQVQVTSQDVRSICDAGVGAVQGP